MVNALLVTAIPLKKLLDAQAGPSLRCGDALYEETKGEKTGKREEIIINGGEEKTQRRSL